MIVRLIEGNDESSGSLIVAVDTIGAGIGEKVLVVGGSSARLLPELMNKPVDAAIVGIIDEGTNE